MRPERHLRSVIASGGGVGEAPPPARHTITLLGARGGQGTTTVACALAVMAAAQRPTRLVSVDPDCSAAVLGLARPTATPVTIGGTLRLDTVLPDDEFAVVDGGRLDDVATPRPGLRLVVLRGPCYLALSALHDHAGAYDAVVVVEEPDRALTARDVTDVLDVPVVATVRASVDVAQAIDAGLLVARVHRLAALANLRRVLDPRHAAPAPPDQHTDLHRPKVGRFSNEIACRVRPSHRHLVMVWKSSGGAEHRSARRRRGRVLPR